MTSESGLPPGIETAWGLRERPSKGPKPGLSLDRIVRAAIDVAAADGFAAVSMNRVAKELGASAMALYRYVTSKNELVALMVDAAIGAPPDRPADEKGWRAGLERWCWAYLGLLRANTWTLSVPITELPNTPNQMAWLEDGLTSLRGTGLTEGEKISIILLLGGYVRNTATTFHTIGEAMRATGGSADEVMAAYADIMRKLIDPNRFPSIAALIQSGEFDRADPDDKEFVFGLDRILDGIEALIRSRA
jgi:AcrR family transcriptional regulator